MKAVGDENIISVIVVTYNQENTISRTLDSVLCQQCHLPFEIVIGEDCSTDGTRQICEKYAHDYPDIVRLMDKAPNKGVIDNYYDCLSACRGKYIADCAGDDYWVDPMKLEKECTILENHPEVTLVHTDWLCYEEHTGHAYRSGRAPFTSPFTDGHTMLEAIVTQTNRPVIHLCTAMYRAEILFQEYIKVPTLFRNTSYGCEDLQICFIMAYKGVIAYLPDVTLHYSMGHDSVSSSANHDRQFRFIRRVTDLSLCLCKRYGIDGVVVQSFFRKRAFALAMHAFRSNNPRLRDEAASLSYDWNIKLTAPTKVIILIMRCRPMWTLTLCIRKIFVRLKAAWR